MQKFHSFGRLIRSEEWPSRFTFPFHYVPHPLSVEAARAVQSYLRSQAAWIDELERGKMFGVLVVATPENEVGFLAAFSGLLAGENEHPYFVPPVYDLLQPDGFFRHEEEQISALNAEIDRIESGKAYREALTSLDEDTRKATAFLADMKLQLKAAKSERDARRRLTTDAAVLAELIRESQHEKAEFRRLRLSWEKRLAERQKAVDDFRTQVEAMKGERRRRSALLQQRLFEQFQVYNAYGERKDLCEIFLQKTGQLPPAGAGECAAPKLLQYAYLKGYKPLAMAEFWWGTSPKTELRRHGYFYPACKGKCGPILGFMLQGLDVDRDPLTVDSSLSINLPIVYEDEWVLVVNKPAGMLSVPGKTEADSVYGWAQRRLPEATGPLVVHRLDMATSGLLLIAKEKRVHQNLQAQFKNRTVRKRYIALLDGVWEGASEGMISLPLRPDPLDRPRQVVDETDGKPAVTRYAIMGDEKGRTRIAFYPETGRTHQLRVHAAHPSGLNLPIRGDELYGRPADRLYLHAQSITFTHPVTGASITVETKAPF